VASSADGAKLVAVANGSGIYTWQTHPNADAEYQPQWERPANLLAHPFFEFRAPTERRHQLDQLDGGGKRAGLKPNEPPESGHAAASQPSNILPAEQRRALIGKRNWIGRLRASALRLGCQPARARPGGPGSLLDSPSNEWRFSELAPTADRVACDLVGRPFDHSCRRSRI